MILKFRVYEQTISLQSTQAEPRQGSKDYLELQFSFSSDWNDLLKYVYIQHGEVSVPHDLVGGSVLVDEYFTEQTEFNVTLFGKSADGSVEVPTNVITIFLKESNDLWVKDAPEPQNSWFVQVVDARDEALAAAIRAENAAIHQPYPNTDTGTWWVWDEKAETYVDTGESSQGPTGITVDGTELPAEDGKVALPIVTDTSESVATGDSALGLCKILPFSMLYASGGAIDVKEANPSAIAQRSSAANDVVLTAPYVNDIVKAALTDENRISGLTDAEKKNACSTIGSVYDGRYELIETITLTEDVTQISRTTSPDGEAYNFKKLFIAYKGEKTMSRVRVQGNYKYGDNAFEYNCYIVANHTTGYLEIDASDVLKYYGAGGPNIAYTVQWCTTGAYAQIQKADSITSLIISGTNSFYAGTVINIYGVRA